MVSTSWKTSPQRAMKLFYNLSIYRNGQDFSKIRLTSQSLFVWYNSIRKDIYNICVTFSRWFKALSWPQYCTKLLMGSLLTSKLEPYSKHVTKYKTKGENKYKVQIDEFIRLNTSHTKPIYTITYCAYHNHTHSNTVHTQYHILIS